MSEYRVESISWEGRPRKGIQSSVVKIAFRAAENDSITLAAHSV